jgi:hypothetical protein
MKGLTFGILLSGLVAMPLVVALKAGDKAPDGQRLEVAGIRA